MKKEYKCLYKSNYLLALMLLFLCPLGLILLVFRDDLSIKYRAALAFCCICFFNIAVLSQFFPAVDYNTEIIINNASFEKSAINDDEFIVYLNENGEKYHYDKVCAGKTAYKSTYEQAKKADKKPCQKCVSN